MTKASKPVQTAYTDGFLLFWNAYPQTRREGKVDVFRIWQERALETRAVEIAEKVARLTMTLWAGREKKYLPMPATWLNQARYEDELVPIEVAHEQELYNRTNAREYESIKAGQRFVERHHAQQRQRDFSGCDDEALDGIEYHAYRTAPRNLLGCPQRSTD